MSLSEYDIQRVLGRGDIGQVYLARNARDGKLYAVKKIILTNEKMWLLAEQEASLLCDIKYSNIISYKESFVDHTGCLHIITKFAPKGDLAAELAKRMMNNDILTEHEVMTWSIQIFMALKYLHNRGILHRDLKPRNIFLNKAGIIKVGDLGIARVLEMRSDMETTFVGSQCYMSPELVARKPYNHKSDIWSLGCCMYEMIAFKRAFDAEDMIGLEMKIIYRKTPRMPLLYSKSIRDLVADMLRKHSKNRPRITTILKNEYVKSHIRRVLDEIEMKKKFFAQENEVSAKVIPVTTGSRQFEKQSECCPTPQTASNDSIHDDEHPTHLQYEQTRLGLSKERTSESQPHFPNKAYNPNKYTSVPPRNSNERHNTWKGTHDKMVQDSGYRSDVLAGCSTPLDSSLELLESSVRFYPVTTLSGCESSHAKNSDVCQDELTLTSHGH